MEVDSAIVKVVAPTVNGKEEEEDVELLSDELPVEIDEERTDERLETELIEDVDVTVCVEASGSVVDVGAEDDRSVGDGVGSDVVSNVGEAVFEVSGVDAVVPESPVVV